MTTSKKSSGVLWSSSSSSQQAPTTRPLLLRAPVFTTRFEATATITSNKNNPHHFKCIIQLHDGTLLVGFENGTIRRWTEDGKQLLGDYKGLDRLLPVRCLVQIDRRSFLGGCGLMDIKLWSLEIDAKIESSKARFMLHSRVSCLTRLRNKRNKEDGYDFASSSCDESVIRVWSLQKVFCVKTLTSHSSQILAMCELQNGFLASASKDQTIKIWNIKISTTAVQSFNATTSYWSNSANLFQFSSGRLISLFDRDLSGCHVWAHDSSSDTYCYATTIGSNLEGRMITKVTGSTFVLLHEKGLRVYHENGDCLWIARIEPPVYHNPSFSTCIVSLRNGTIAVGRMDGGLDVYKVQGTRCGSAVI